MMSQKRQKLIDAAEKMFYKEGFFATGVDQVIKRAGISRRTMYQHFQSKEDLVVSVLRQRDRAYFDYIDRDRPVISTSSRDIALYIAKMHTGWLGSQGLQGCIFMKALAEYSTHSKKVAGVACEHKHSLHRYLTRLFTNAGVSSSESAALRLCLLLEGATQLAQVFNIEEVHDSLIHNVTTSFPAK